MTRIVRSIQEARGQLGPCAVTIGNFDGVHIGHQALLDETKGYAVQHGIHSSVLTFNPHPTVIVAPDRTPLLICSLEQRLGLLASAEIDSILVLPFTEEVARLSPEEFVSQILVDVFETRAVFIGQNFHFGHKQAGTPQTLKTLGGRYGFVSRVVEPVTYRGELVSSSTVRRYLEAGNVERAGRLLGHCFSIEGPVVHGRGIGRRETVPTLNLGAPAGQVVPRGIFITETIDRASGRRWESVTSVGTNPTFGETDLTIETYLLSPPFDGRTPDSIKVLFRHFIRAERTFPNAESLKKQIFNDVSRAQTYWRRVNSFRVSEVVKRSA